MWSGERGEPGGESQPPDAFGLVDGRAQSDQRAEGEAAQVDRAPGCDLCEEAPRLRPEVESRVETQRRRDHRARGAERIDLCLPAARSRADPVQQDERKRGHRGPVSRTSPCGVRTKTCRL